MSRWRAPRAGATPRATAPKLYLKTWRDNRIQRVFAFFALFILGLVLRFLRIFGFLVTSQFAIFCFFACCWFLLGAGLLWAILLLRLGFGFGFGFASLAFGGLLFFLLAIWLTFLLFIPFLQGLLESIQHIS